MAAIDDNLLEVIARRLPDLRKSDRRVAEVVLERPMAVPDMKLAELAAAAGVSEPTVIRFCTAVGCAGFRDLGLKLARSAAFARTTSHAAIAPGDNLDTVVTKIFDFNLSSLTWARSHLDVASIGAAVDILQAAERIEFFGFGASGIVARDAQQKFPLLGVPCGAPGDAHQMYITAAMMRRGDAVVAISNTGSTREVVEAATLARQRGAKTIGISGRDGPLLEQCDVAIKIETLENTDLYTPTVSRLSAMVVIDILSTAVSLAKPEEQRERIVRMKTGLSALRGGPRAADAETGA